MGDGTAGVGSLVNARALCPNPGKSTSRCNNGSNRDHARALVICIFSECDLMS